MNVKIGTDYSKDVFDFTKKPYDALLQPPDEESPKNIHNALNDDCLREVFKKLHLLDLSSVADVCVRFNGIAKDIFHSKSKDEMFNLKNLNRHVDMRMRSVKPTLAQIDDFLRNFGSSITSIKEYSNDSDIVMPLINKYCVKLEEIKMYGYSKNQTLVELFQLFARLKKLKVFCGSSKVGSIFRSTKIFRFISQYFSNIEELRFCTSEDFHFNPGDFFGNIAHLSQLEKMKKLHLSFYHDVYVPVWPIMQALLTKNVPIEDLTLKNAWIDDLTVDCISQMKNIESLRLHSPHFKNEHLFELVRNLPNINRIQIDIQ